MACQTIAFTRGVCGKAASTGQAQLVDNVHSFPGHIACDDATNSEIVVPIISSGKVSLKIPSIPNSDHICIARRRDQKTC